MKKKTKSWILSLSSKNVAFISIVFIFFILLAQSGISLFFSQTSEGLGQIDIVFRTSLSSIFGYLMSVVSIKSVLNAQSKEASKKTRVNSIGFQGESNKGKQKQIEMIAQTESIRGEVTQNESVDTAKAPILEQQKTDDLPLKKVPLNYQIIILAGSCAFCLLIMVVVRNFSQYLIPSDSSVATLSLYRDFVSASIGALIGISKD